MKYAIPEMNIERLEKKLTRIRNKCERYGATFTYEQVGEEFRTFTDDEGRESKVKYILVDVEGHAEITGWEFVAAIEHLSEGNIIRNVTDYHLPDRYYKCGPTCQHCNRVRSRKETYIVRNEESGEFIQVGRSCLRDYTGGMDAEFAAAYLSVFQELEEDENVDRSSFNFAGRCSYFSTKEILRYAIEAVRCFGYSKTYFEDGTPNPDSTRNIVLDCVLGTHGDMVPAFEELRRLPEYMFDVDSEEVQKKADRIISYFQDDSFRPNSSYEVTLKTISNMECVSVKEFGYVVSMVSYYKRVQDKLRRDAEQAIEQSKSQYIGNVGDKVEVDLKDAELVTCFENVYGITFLYRMHDNEGNVLTWFASSSQNLDEFNHIKGTIKKHEEYKGVKQTILTRCRIW